MKRLRTQVPETPSKKSKTNITSVTKHQLLNYNLGKQGLLQRCASNTPIHQFGYLHSTNQTTPYLSLFTRIQDFNWKTLASQSSPESGQNRSFYRIRCMRGTQHLVPSSDLMMISQIYLKPCSTPDFTRQKVTTSEATLKSASKQILKVLTKNGGLTAAGIKKHLPSDKYKKDVVPTLRWLLLSKEIEYGAQNVSDWRKTDYTYSILKSEDKPKYFLETKAANNGITALMSSYFSLYGPATLSDFVWWSAVSVTDSRKSLNELKENGTLVPISVDGYILSTDKDPLFMLSSQIQELTEASNGEPNMVRFFPYEDAMFKAYKRTRNRFYGFDDKLIPEGILMGGEMYPCLMVGGKVVGKWFYGKIGGAYGTAMTYSFKTKEELEVDLMGFKLNEEQEELLKGEKQLLVEFLQCTITE